MAHLLPNTYRPVRSGAQNTPPSRRQSGAATLHARDSGSTARMNWRRQAVRPSTTGRNARLLVRRGAALDIRRLGGMGILPGLLGAGSDDSSSENEHEAEDELQGLVDVSFFNLKVIGILPADQLRTRAADGGTSASAGDTAEPTQFSFASTDSGDGEEPEDSLLRPESTDYVLNGLCGEVFCVGPRGATIGTAKGCDIRLPKSSRAQPTDTRVQWVRRDSAADGDVKDNDETSALTFDDFMGHGQFSVTGEPNSTLKLHVTDSDGQGGHDVKCEKADVLWSMKFTVGRLKFRVQPLKPSKLAKQCLFAAVRNNNVDILKSVMAAAKVSGGLKGGGESCPLLRQTSVQSTKRLNLDIYEDYPAQSSPFDEEEADEVAEVRSPFSTMLTTQAASRARQRRRTHRLSRVYAPGRTPVSCLLLLAVEIGNPDIVSLLLDEGANPNHLTAATSTFPLHVAVSKDNVSVARILLQHGADAEVPDKGERMPYQLAMSHEMRKLLLGIPLMCSAAEAGDCEEVQRLLDQGIPPNAVGLGSKNALHFACMGGHLGIVTQLLMAGAKVDSKGGTRKRTPLHYAALSGSVEVAQCLLEGGAREHMQDALGYVALNLTNNAEMCRLLNTQSPALCLAAQGGDIAEARRLLDNKELGVEETLELVNQRNEQHHAAVHLACVSGNIEFLQLLIQHSADVDLPGGADLWTPMMFAAMSGEAKTVEYLLSVGADQSLMSTKGSSVQDLVTEALGKVKDEQRTGAEHPRLQSYGVATAEESTALAPPPLILRQISHPNYSEQRQWLERRLTRLEAVLDVLRSGPQQMQQALNNNDLQTARSLLKDGVAAANCIFDHPLQGSALYHACAMGHTEFAALLLDHGGSILSTGEDGLTPAHIAAFNGQVETLKLLLEHGQDVQVREANGSNTLLHIAAMVNRPAVVQLLLERGADRSALNNDDLTPFQTAKQVNVQRLLAQGAERLIVEARAGSVTRVRSLLSSEDGVSHDELLALGDAANAPGSSPLHEAAMSNHVGVVEVLVEASCDINAKAGSRMQTVLHIAARRGHLDLAKYLMEQKARVDIKDLVGQTPFEVANDNTMRKLLVQPQRVIKIQALAEPNDDIPDNKRCRICMDKAINTIVLPCGHQAFCSECAGRLKECALDRQPIREVVKVFCN